MLLLTLKQLEYAVRAGRLEEAAALLDKPGVREHRNGQSLTDKLAHAYADRARTHLESARLADAMHDLHAAERLTGHQPGLAELRDELARAMRDQHEAQQRKQSLRQAAQKQIADGFFSNGLAILKTALLNQDSTSATMLQQDVDHQRNKLERAIELSQLCLEQGQLVEALTQLHQARQIARHDARVLKLASEINQPVAQALRECFNDRNVKKFQALLDAAMLAIPGEDAALHFAPVPGLLASLRANLNAGHYRQAKRDTSALKEITDARWLTAMVEQLGVIAREIDKLEDLGPIPSVDVAATVRESTPIVNIDRSVDPIEPLAQNRISPKSQLLQIEGIGAYILHRGDRITLGSISSSDRPDVGFITDPSAPTITLERSEDDIVLSSSREVMVNDKPTRQAIVRDGDRIAISPRCRLRLRRPNVASSSVVFELSSAKLPRGDVRQILWMDRELLIGPTRDCHVLLPSPSEPMTLLADGSGLLVRTNVESRSVQVGHPAQIGSTEIRLAHNT